MSLISDLVASTQPVDTKTKANNTDSTSSTSKKAYVSGKTIGKPQLSEKASKYYEELKKKYSNMDFILVSADQKEAAKAQAGSYANANKMVVLIDEEKIERMAEDENYRKQYEGIIANAASGLSQMQSSLAATGAKVKGYGMQVNDNGTASFFAVIDKSLAAQKERIEKKAAQNKEDKKAAKKKAAQKKAEQKADQKKEERLKKEERIENGRPYGSRRPDEEDSIVVTASSLEELISKVRDTVQNMRMDQIQTEAEKQVGQNFNFSI